MVGKIDSVARIVVPKKVRESLGVKNGVFVNRKLGQKTTQF
jgi:bifunctional DNA-binding transcriptional regulator/antitoxin component of YhaV-PrlF toxin-antitoxin module